MARMIYPEQFRNGMVIRYDGEKYAIKEFVVIKGGKMVPHVRAILQRVDNGLKVDRSIRLTEQVELLSE